MVRTHRAPLTRRTNDLGRSLNQIVRSTRFELLAFRRNPAATFFAVILPVMFLILFGFIFGGDVTEDGAKIATFQVPGILAMTVVSDTFVNSAISATFERELGLLKRLRATPMRPFVWVVSKLLASSCLVAFMTLLVTLVGRVLFGVVFNLETLPVLIGSLFLGTLSMSVLGLALTAAIPSRDAAPAITNFIVLPLYFVSEVFLQPAEGILNDIGRVFPVMHISKALQPSYDPFLTDVSVPWAQWMVILAWGVFGMICAVKFFRWEPRRKA